MAASFLGGAFVNGPGLQWIEAWLLKYLGLNNGSEIASVDLKPAVGPDTDLDESRLTKLATAVSKQPRAQCLLFSRRTNQHSLVTLSMRQHLKLDQSRNRKDLLWLTPARSLWLYPQSSIPWRHSSVHSSRRPR